MNIIYYRNMRRSEEVYRELLEGALEKKQFVFTQSGISKKLSMSLSIVNLALKPLNRMHAIAIRQRSLEITDTKKILYYWASTRNLEKDIVYKTRVEKPIRTIESEMPSQAIFGGYSAYKFIFGDIPADYSEVYIYTNEIEELKKRFPLSKNPPNIFALKKDPSMTSITMAQLFVDLWNLKEWYAKDFLKSMEEKLHGLLE